MTRNCLVYNLNGQSTGTCGETLYRGKHLVVVVVVVFTFQYGNIHSHTSGSIFNKNIFEKKLFERVKKHTKINHK